MGNSRLYTSIGTGDEETGETPQQPDEKEGMIDSLKPASGRSAALPSRVDANIPPDMNLAAPMRGRVGGTRIGGIQGTPYYGSGAYKGLTRPQVKEGLAGGGLSGGGINGTTFSRLDAYNKANGGAPPPSWGQSRDELYARSMEFKNSPMMAAHQSADQMANQPPMNPSVYTKPAPLSPVGAPPSPTATNSALLTAATTPPSASQSFTNPPPVINPPLMLNRPPAPLAPVKPPAISPAVSQTPAEPNPYLDAAQGLKRGIGKVKQDFGNAGGRAVAAGQKFASNVAAPFVGLYNKVQKKKQQIGDAYKAFTAP